MKKSKLLALFCTLLSVFSFQIAFGQYSQGSQNQNELSNKIKEAMERNKTVGLSVAVVKDGKLHFVESYGLKNIEKNIPLQTQDIFRIASISKSFTATGIMQLLDAGKFKLEDDISDLIGFKVRNPKFPNTKITLKMLLSHTSSLSDKEGYFELDVLNPEKNENWANVFNDYEPGSEYQYCNLNFNMLGAVIERYTQKRFDNYIVENILDPLQIYGGFCVDSLDNNLFTNLYSYQAKTDSFTHSPAAYNPRSEEIKNYTLGYSTPIFSPTGGMKISAKDLAQYMIMHMNYGSSNGKTIISERSSKLMQTPVLESSNYGLALNVKDNYIQGEKMVGHTGSAYGLFSNMYFQPEEKFGFVIITNGTKPNYTDEFLSILHETANILYEHFIKD